MKIMGETLIENFIHQQLEYQTNISLQTSNTSVQHQHSYVLIERMLECRNGAALTKCQ